MRAAACYFLHARNARGTPVDAVARFHLGNGARLEQINFLGDGSENGIAAVARHDGELSLRSRRYREESRGLCGEPRDRGLQRGEAAGARRARRAGAAGFKLISFKKSCCNEPVQTIRSAIASPGKTFIETRRRRADDLWRHARALGADRECAGRARRRSRATASPCRSRRRRRICCFISRPCARARSICRSTRPTRSPSSIISSAMPSRR